MGFGLLGRHLYLLWKAIRLGGWRVSYRVGRPAKMS